MLVVKVGTEKSLWRPKIDRLSNTRYYLSEWESQTPVDKSEVLFIAVGPHIPICTLHQLSW